MKIRSGFVSNSSSSSFVISKEDLNELQIALIQSHDTVAGLAHNLPPGVYLDPEDRWDIEVTDSEVKGYTPMDNFDMDYFLEKLLGIESEKITWDHWG